MKPSPNEIMVMFHSGYRYANIYCNTHRYNSVLLPPTPDRCRWLNARTQSDILCTFLNWLGPSCGMSDWIMTSQSMLLRSALPPRIHSRVTVTVPSTRQDFHCLIVRLIRLYWEDNNIHGAGFCRGNLGIDWSSTTTETACTNIQLYQVAVHPEFGHSYSAKRRLCFALHFVDEWIWSRPCCRRGSTWTGVLIQ